MGSIERQQKLTTESDLDKGQVRAALRSAIKSDAFSGALRLQEFLTYVVEEKLAGRQDGIQGKTIAVDVYNRKIEGLGDRDKVVRVDASRLRRRLDQYYTSEGRQDAINISIPLGGYVPKFNRRSRMAAKTIAPSPTISTGVNLKDPQSKTSQATKLEMQRRVMFEKSPASLQANKIALQARSMIWPPSDPVQLNAALDIFERAIALDNKYFGGYAGAASIYAFKAMLPGHGGESELLTKAHDLASKAREINPTEAWVQSTLAWIAFVEKDYDRSTKLSAQAIILDPSDLFVRHFHFAIQILSGEFEEGLASLEPLALSTEQAVNLSFVNTSVPAYFHLGRYDDTIAQIRMLGEKGGDISPLLMVYLAAAYQASDDTKAAQTVAHELRNAWPDFQPEELLLRVFRFPEHPKAVLDLLYIAGWSPE